MSEVMKKSDLLFWIFISLFIGLGGIYVFFGQKSFYANTKYTVATVTSDFHYKSTSGGAGYDYIFFIKGSKETGTMTHGNFIKGNRYIVAYDSTNLRTKRLLNIEVTDSVFVYPTNGWKLEDIPLRIDKEYIKRLFLKK